MIPKSKIHGLVSILIIELCIVIALFSIALKSLMVAATYFIGITIAAILILYLFCSKCSSKNNCSHVYPGQLAKVFKNQTPIKYTRTDYLVTGLSLAFVILSPQYWLWQNKMLFITYWALTVFSLIKISTQVCSTCNNIKCVMCKQKHRL